MNAIFIVGEHPRSLHIAVRTGEAGFYGSYNIFETEYGWSDCDKITESDQFKEISPMSLPPELVSDEGFKRIIKNIDKVYIHKS